MGPVTSDPCEHFQGLIAMEVIGQLSVHERVALERAHRRLRRRVATNARTSMMLSMVLGTADPDRFNEHELPFRLQTAVLDRLRAEERRERRAAPLALRRGHRPPPRWWWRSSWC